MRLFKDALKFLENSQEFKDWKKENSNTFLSCGFSIINENQENDWRIGYYHTKDDKITSFVVGKSISIEPESEVFKKETTKVNKIDTKNLKYTVNKALEIAQKLQEQKYKDEKPNKIIIILQKLKTGQIWNVTYISLKFNTLNIKIDTKTGKVLSHKLSSIFEFRK
jgi:hypothetical protein